MVRLGINIDHVATLRQARGGRDPEPVAAAVEAELSGADLITVHVREDRRHINDRDLRLLREVVTTELNQEMALADDIIQLALEVRPDHACLVPERRQELTTEGGLDVTAETSRVKLVTQKLKLAGCRVFAFVDPDEPQILACSKAGVDGVELHTGRFAEAFGREAEETELDRLAGAAEMAANAGLEVHAGHGLNYRNTPALLDAVPQVVEVNIGHAIVARGVFVGLGHAVSEMRSICDMFHGE
ncbi:MAG TPA: pyridoxine 5'-phosphate synthase [Candidatus Saccharimonadales bacterium]|nr:pyridoxine 5'-phosphate synthase [Candidatus Saccharimonadales bacterium]